MVSGQESQGGRRAPRGTGRAAPPAIAPTGCGEQLVSPAQLAAALGRSIPLVMQNGEKQLSSEQGGPIRLPVPLRMAGLLETTEQSF